LARSHLTRLTIARCVSFSWIAGELSFCCVHNKVHELFVRHGGTFLGSPTRGGGWASPARTPKSYSFLQMAGSSIRRPQRRRRLVVGQVVTTICDF
jgi:hypothetical protein